MWNGMGGRGALYLEVIASVSFVSSPPTGWDLAVA